MENSRIADIFDRIAVLMELRNENEFRVRAYRDAARTVRGHYERVEDMAAQGKDLTELPNIGESTAEKIGEIIETGTCKRFEELKNKVPEGLVEVMSVPGVGPSKARLLHGELGVESMEDLKAAVKEKRVQDLKGMGEKTEKNILEGIKTVESSEGRFLRFTAMDYAESVGRMLDEVDSVKDWKIAGSYRRRKETVGDLDILIISGDRDNVIDRILDYRSVEEVIAKGRERVSVMLDNNLQVDFRFFNKENFGSAVMYFTGSKAHNIALRKIAVDRGWKLNEYGIFKGNRKLAGKTEEGMYQRLNLEWVPPEIREDMGEIEAAANGRLPRLVKYGDIKGDLHSHTDLTDGNNTLEEMAREARDRGLEYLAVTDHSRRVTMAKGMDDSGAMKNADRIRELGHSMEGIELLAGVEVDILKSGKLDLKEKTLEKLDWVVASVHYDTDMSGKKMTNRLVAAIESGVVNCLGHPMDRLIGKRDMLEFDLDKVIGVCVENGVFIEINSQPDRLDFPDTYCRRATEAGAGFAVCSDAHSISDFDYLELGAGVARRGWLKKNDVLNTLTAGKLKKKLGLG